MVDNSNFVKSLGDATLHMALDMEKKVGRACLIVERAAKQGCPVDQGILRASITTDTEITEQAIIGRIGSNLEYAPYVHNGTGIYAKDGDGRKTPWGYAAKGGKYKGYHVTRGQRPQPFLEDAKVKSRKAVEKALGD